MRQLDPLIYLDAALIIQWFSANMRIQSTPFFVVKNTVQLKAFVIL
jgi:hypothetical protein